MRAASSDGAMRIQAVLGDGFRVLEFEESTHSSVEAAAAIGCDVAQIAKSMLFRAADATPVLVVASGANRVDEKKVAALLGRKVSRADAGFVLGCSGFAVGACLRLGTLLRLQRSWIGICRVMGRCGRRRVRRTRCSR